MLPVKREGKFPCIKVAFNCRLATVPVYQVSGMCLTPEMASCIWDFLEKALDYSSVLPHLD